MLTFITTLPLPPCGAFAGEIVDKISAYSSVFTWVGVAVVDVLKITKNKLIN